MIRALASFLLALVWCRHVAPRLERRFKHGVQVPHYVCDRCGTAWPVLERTASEHRRVFKVGAVRRPKARIVPPAVEATPKIRRMWDR